MIGNNETLKITQKKYFDSINEYFGKTVNFKN